MWQTATTKVQTSPASCLRKNQLALRNDVTKSLRKTFRKVMKELQLAGQGRRLFQHLKNLSSITLNQWKWNHVNHISIVNLTENSATEKQSTQSSINYFCRLINLINVSLIVLKFSMWRNKFGQQWQKPSLNLAVNPNEKNQLLSYKILMWHYKMTGVKWDHAIPQNYFRIVPKESEDSKLFQD